MQKEYLTPAAILVGSVIIGAGLYFGLQGREAPPAPPPAPAPALPAPTRPEPARAAAPPQAGAAAGVGLSPPGVPADVRKQVEEDVRKDLERQRPELVKACWAPSFAKKADPPRAKYIYNVSFDPSGREIARGISEVRGMERPDTAQCLRARPMGIQVRATGLHVGVEVELVLP